jgi:hypothetical protein
MIAISLTDKGRKHYAVYVNLPTGPVNLTSYLRVNPKGLQLSPAELTHALTNGLQKQIDAGLCVAMNEAPPQVAPKVAAPAVVPPPVVPTPEPAAPVVEEPAAPVVEQPVVSKRGRKHAQQEPAPAPEKEPEVK